MYMPCQVTTPTGLLTGLYIGVGPMGENLVLASNGKVFTGGSLMTLFCLN